MNLFFKALFSGELTSTIEVEQRMNAFPGINKRFREIEKSNLLSEYRQLDAFVHSETFKTNQKNAARLAKLSKNSNIKTYNKLVNDAELKRFVAFASVPEHYARLSDKEALKTDITLRRMKKLDGSKKVATWRKIEHSSEIVEYLELCKMVADYSQQEKRYAELCKNDDIKFFLSQDVKKHERFESYQTVFENNFDVSAISHKGWKAGFAYPEGFKAIHSFTNQHQAYVGGQNVHTTKGKLQIVTKKVKVTAAAWDEKKGMINMDFAYTSAVIHNTTEFEAGEVIQIKTRCRGKINHNIYLRDKKNNHILSLVRFAGGNAYCGINDHMQSIPGVKSKKFIIYTMFWGKDEIVWYLNGVEVARTKNTIPQSEKLFLHISSSQDKSCKMSNGLVEVDWLKVYKQK